CFSFYPTKNLGTMGDGGALWTPYKTLYKFLKQAVHYGEGAKFRSEFVSGHSRLPEIQAGILNIYLQKIKKDFSRRKRVFTLYQEYFKKYGVLSKVKILYQNKESDPILHQFVIQARRRDQLKSYLKRKGIDSFIHYPYPIHLLPAFSYLGYKVGSFPNSERLCKKILSLPFHPYLSKKQIDFIVKSIRQFYYG
ncbi:DegT/DnrJ/EryC1/StrS family aminotransferase, partial [Candidatus Roizmanbacteria bacterium]|nr:DegT/DnrJ/EryC1/StrS family aminotransferase [Candidatus Roizmanbacteria bacterium]